MAEPFDVFISYARADGEWAHVLAENLHQSALAVFLDEWYIAPGDVLVHQLDDALARTRNGVLILLRERARASVGTRGVRGHANPRRGR